MESGAAGRAQQAAGCRKGGEGGCSKLAWDIQVGGALEGLEEGLQGGLWQGVGD